MIFRPHRENLLLFRGRRGEATAYRLLLLSSHFYSPSSSSLNSFPFHTDISMPLPSSSSSSFPRPYSQKRQREKKERWSSESRGRLRRRTRAHFQDSLLSRFPTQTPEEKGRREGENVRRRTAGCKKGGGRRGTLVEIPTTPLFSPPSTSFLKKGRERTVDGASAK